VTTVAEFMGSAAASPLNGSSAWASRYAGELRRVVVEHAARAPRTLQVALGPSEIGHECDRQVVGKMAGLPVTNHVTDPWPSIMGTAGHAWLADAFSADNARHGLRWVPEQRVEPAPGLKAEALAHQQSGVRLAKPNAAAGGHRQRRRQRVARPGPDPRP